MLTRCPKCGKEIPEDADICKFCKYDFTKEVIKGSGRRVAPQDPALKAPRKDKDDLSEIPPHMLGEAKGPDMRREEDILPPHMLEGAKQVDLSPRVAEAPKSGGTGFYVLIGAVILGALAAPKFLKKKEEPPPPPVTVEAPEPEDEVAVEEAKKTGPVEEKKAEAKVPAPPPLDEKAPAKTPRKKRPPPRRVAKAPPAAPAPPPAAASAPRPSRASKWRVRGKLIDIISLKPIPDADLVFVAANGQRVATATGPGGDFRVSMQPVSGGYTLRISHPEYDSKYLASENQTGMDEDERKEIAEKLVSSYAKNLSVQPGGDGLLNQDYLLVPRPKHGMSLEEALLKGGAQ